MGAGASTSGETEVMPCQDQDYKEFLESQRVGQISCLTLPSQRETNNHNGSFQLVILVELYWNDQLGCLH